MELPRSNYVEPRRRALDQFPQAITGALIGASTFGATAAVGAPLDEPPLVDGRPPDDDESVEQDLWRSFHRALDIDLVPYSAPPSEPPSPQIPERFASFVRHGTDAGDFYCEHAYFVAQALAHAEGSAVAKNEHGEYLVGFLHVPRDQWTGVASDRAYSQAERHERTREIVGAAIRGYFEAAAGALGAGEPFRLLLTGFGPFGDTHDNPTESFVRQQENLDAAMQLGFGEGLIAPIGQPLDEVAGGAVTEYLVVHGGEERSIQIHTLALPVADVALDPTASGSLPAAFIDGRPHAILSLGVRPITAYELEFLADDGGLRRSGETPAAHDGSVSPSERFPPNYSLARALGAQ